MLGSEYSWLFDCNADQQASEYLLDASTYACTDGADTSAGFDLSSVDQEPSTNSTTQLNSSQQPPWFDATTLSVDPGVDFASLFTDTEFSAPNQNPNPVHGQNVGSLTAYQDHASPHHEIETGFFYRNARSAPHQYIDPAFVSQDVNPYDTNAALSMQHVPDISLREEVKRPLFEEAPCVLEFGMELVTESGTKFGTADESPQLDCEQPQQNRRHETVETRAETREKLKKQDERISELELALQQLQQLQQASPELPQNFIDIPRQWIEVQTNFEQYFERFRNWAEEHSQAKAGDTLRTREKVEDLEAEVLALKRYINSSG